MPASETAEIFKLRRFPVLTLLTLGATVCLTASRLAGPRVEQAINRDPAALRHGQWWRLISPVLVQSDHSVIVVLLTFAVCAVIGVMAESRLTRPCWFALYLAGALAGHGLGEAFQPHQSGTSVAFVGILGGLAARILLTNRPVPPIWRFRIAVGVVLSAVDTALGDIHGVAFLAGLAVGMLWLSGGRGALPAPTR
jgi:membrane associated rhomboid family serine protease